MNDQAEATAEIRFALGHQLACALNQQQLARWDLTRLVRQLADYLQLILDWNRRVDLVAPASIGELVERHLTDSFLAWVALGESNFAGGDEFLGTRILDVGTGAGLPGVVWAIANPHTIFHLLEPRDKRVQFLKEVRRRLALQNVEIHPKRLEDFVAETTADRASTNNKQSDESCGALRFSATVCRALGESELFLAESARILLPAGRALMLVGPEQKLPQPPDELLSYCLPLSGARRGVAVFTRSRSGVFVNFLYSEGDG